MSGRRLSPEEKKLWRRVTRDVVMQTPKTGLGEDAGVAAGALENRTPSKAALHQSAAVSSAPQKPPAGVKPLTVNAGAGEGGFVSRQTIFSVDAMGAGDPGADKRVSRRRQPIDRVLDLHGLTQIFAEKKLTDFLQAARRDDCRCVLVITGKGGRRSDDVEASRGVLHRRLSDWVNQAPLRSLIARVAPAHQKDGGAGAWYVFLKRR